ncbi:hypothetical protein PT974_05328 [Cladobotryum mycophilum]|uniref:Uncharacterized protein n=1 Tax=Cladobotryum mycophilum TaxID=491253 RepID=A0ABR0SII7_9HYPO
MVQLTTVSIVAVAIMAPFVAADNCRNGINYCGWNLLKKGNYYSQIISALSNAHESTDSNHVNNELFHCDGGPQGDITVIKFCGNGCLDGGSGHDDYC